jgi:hypothetical protein
MFALSVSLGWYQTHLILDDQISFRHPYQSQRLALWHALCREEPLERLRRLRDPFFLLVRDELGRACDFLAGLDGPREAIAQVGKVCITSRDWTSGFRSAG